MLPLPVLLFYAFLAIVAVALVGYFAFVYRVNSRVTWVPGPKSLPVFGTAFLMKDTSDIINVLLRLSSEYSGLFRLQLGPCPASIFITDPNLLQFVMSSNKLIDKSYVYAFLRNWLGFGLLTSTGEKWQQRRKLLTPTFHFQILEQFIDIFNSASDVLVRNLKKHDDQKPFDVYPHITLCTLDVICESAMGVKINAQTDGNKTYVRDIKEIADLIASRVISMIKVHLVFYIFTIDHFKERLLVRKLHNITRTVIKNRRKELLKMKDKNEESLNEDADSGQKRRSPFLDTLIQSTVNGKPLSDDDIREEVDTFMFEGHDTTSSGISFILYSLSKHPDVQEKVMQELTEIFHADKDRPATYTDLQNMKYLEMAIKESLRLYPPVPIIGRLFFDDVAYDGNLFPAGLDVQLLVMGVHRNPDLYPDPLKFDPERFTVENQMKRHPYAYIPFSAGPRNCIGQRFAMLELKSAVSKVLRHYQLLPVENYEPQLVNELTLKSKNGIQIRLKSR